MEDLAAFLVARDEQLWNDDSTWREHMGEIAEVMRPLRKELTGTTGSQGEKRMQRIFDGTPIQAAQNLASGLYGTASNPAENWMGLSLVDKDRAKWGPIKSWLQSASRSVLASFGPEFSVFYAQLPTAYLDLAAFGTKIFSSELRDDLSGFKDLARPLSTHNFDVDGEGRPNTMYVRRSESIDNLADEFGKENLSGTLQPKVGNKTKATAEILQAVLPNRDYLPGMNLDPLRGKKFASITIERETKHVIKRKGFDSFPYFVTRWEVAANERKGRGPGETALPDAKSLNVMTKANLKAGERAADPPWGAADELNGNPVRLAPGKLTYGALDRQGRQLLQPLITGGTTPFSLEMSQALRESIKEYFYFSLMSLANRTGMTPIEWIEYNEQKMRMMAPFIGRIQAEFLGPLVMRRWELLSKVPGAMDPPPPDLQGHIPVVEFVSAAALAQKSARAAGVLRFVQVAGQVTAMNPMSAAKFNGDKALEIAAEGFAVPELINDDETTAANKQALQQAMQAQTAATVAQPAARAAKDGADAIATVRGDKKAAA